MHSLYPVLLSALLGAWLAPSLAIAAPPQPYGATPTPGQQAWDELDSYAFCHFTINTFTDKEWGYGDEDPQLFAPTDFDANQIVGTLAKAGFKGVILTAKHHDGFCLWPTKTTEHNITKSPWRDGKGDMVREFADACRKHEVKFGVYLSPWDRNHAEYGRSGYVAAYKAQLTELLSNYGELFEIWFDGANGGDGYYGGARETRKIDAATYYDWPAVREICRELQPQAVLFSDVGPDVRWIGNERGIASYPCWATYTPQGKDGNPPAPGLTQYQQGQSGTVDGEFWIPGECDVSIRPGWFWHADQNNKVRSPQNLLDLYFASVGRGASLLLNVPPNRAGRIDEPDVASLLKYGEAIETMYGENFAAGAEASADKTRQADSDQSYAAGNVLNAERANYWATPDDAREAALTLQLPQPRTFDVVRLEEPIALGQRIREFVIEVKKDGQWQPWFNEGTSVGGQVVVRGEPATTDAVRVRVTKAAACPCLSEVSLWKTPDLSE